MQFCTLLSINASQSVAIAMQTNVLDVKDMHGLFYTERDICYATMSDFYS